MATTNELGNGIRRAFERSGWSIKRLSDQSGCAYGHTYSFVKGNADMTLLCASRLAKALGLKLVAKKPKG